MAARPRPATIPRSLGPLSFSPAAQPVTQITVPILADNIIEPQETYFLNLTTTDQSKVVFDPQNTDTEGNTEILQGLGVITDTSNLGRIAIDNVTANDGNPANLQDTTQQTATFTVNMPAAVAIPVTVVNFSVADGTGTDGVVPATSPADYQLVTTPTTTYTIGGDGRSGSLLFLAGETSKSIVVDLVLPSHPRTGQRVHRQPDTA